MVRRAGNGPKTGATAPVRRRVKGYPRKSGPDDGPPSLTLLKLSIEQMWQAMMNPRINRKIS